MSKLYKNFIFTFFIFINITFISNYPIFPTILTLSIPISDDNSASQSRVENSFVRWLQASGADLISIHPWSKYEEIDFLLTKVNGILLQGNPDKIDINSAYYTIVKYLYKKTIELNNSGIKMPLIAFGDDLSLLCTIISEDNISINTEMDYRIDVPTKLKLFYTPDKTIILNEFEKEDMKALEKEYILANNLIRYISVKDYLKDFHLSQKFNLIATSKTRDGREYISIIEGNQIMHNGDFRIINIKNKNEPIFPPISLDSLKCKNKNKNRLLNKKSKYRFRIRLNRINKIVLDRYCELKNDFNPFHDSFNKIINNYKKFHNCDYKYNELRKNNFENLLNCYNSNVIQSLPLDESDDDSTTFNTDIEYFKNSYKQFLKLKRLQNV